MATTQPTRTIEDYLHTIYSLQTEGETVISDASHAAHRLGYGAPDGARPTGGDLGQEGDPAHGEGAEAG